MLVVTVCTANLCRSPLAEHALRRAFAARNIETTVASAGLSARTDSAVPRGWADVALGFGVDLTAHRAQHVRDLLDAADLFLVMTAEHARDLAMLDAGTLGRIALLAQAAERLDGEVRGAASDPPTGEANRARVIGARQRAADVLHMGRNWDVADPVRMVPREQARVAAEIVALCDRIAGAWAP